jgi:release factor glutamine methyltransferase
MPSTSRRVFFADHAFDVYVDVYEPAEDSFLFAENLAVSEGSLVLDMGTGCGILGILAAEKAAHVVAVDINPFAVRCAKKNARLNRVSNRLSFVRGDLFGPIGVDDGFDVIFFNAPYLPCEAKEEGLELELAWAGGVTGREIIDRFIIEAPIHLKRHGAVFLMQSTLSDVDETLRQFEGKGLEVQTVARRHFPFFETIVLVKAQY